MSQLAHRSRTRLPLMALGMASLAGALWGGVLRLGWALPAPALPLAAFHGPLMVAGFLGTVIGLERAVALGRPWAYAAPIAAGLGGIALAAGAPVGVGALLTTLGSAGLLAVFAAILRRELATFTVVMAVAAAVWLGGQILWLLGWPLYQVSFWWGGFLVLTIAGERLELSRLVRVTAASRAAFMAAAALLLLGLVLTAVAFEAGVRIVGVGLAALALWLLREDIARRTVRQPGLTRFIALCLLSGYVWLAVGGLLAALAGGIAAGPYYDAMLHAVFLGFVFSMIFGHAPIIFPAVLGWRVAFRPTFYTHLVLLHLTLALRVAGDLAAWSPGRQWGGLLNAFVLLLFFVNTARGVLAGRDSAAR